MKKNILITIMLFSMIICLRPLQVNAAFASNDEIRYLEDSKKDEIAGTETEQTETCTALFGNPDNEGDTAFYLQRALDLIKYAGIVACIALTVVEFMKAVLADDKDMLKPLSKKAFNRLIYAVILFFLPIITEAILDLIGVYGTCSIS